MTYNEWAIKYPEASAALRGVLNAVSHDAGANDGRSEAWAQQRARLTVAHAGGLAYRNNVGATPAKCPDCGVARQPVRYGLANDSAKLNKRLKSSDLICAIPRVIRPVDVGSTIAQFGAIETKRPGWAWSGNEREVAQAAFLSLVASKGGFAMFSTGEVTL